MKYSPPAPEMGAGVFPNAPYWGLSGSIANLHFPGLGRGDLTLQGILPVTLNLRSWAAVEECGVPLGAPQGETWGPLEAV